MTLWNMVVSAARISAAAGAGMLALSAEPLAGGWQINGLVSAYSGAPFSVTAADTPLNMPCNVQRADQVGLRYGF